MRLLYRHFLRAFFVSDLVARGGDPRALAITAAAFFSAPGLVICMYLMQAEGQVDTTPELAFFIALGMILTGLAAVIEWDELFPSRTDFMVLRPLPLDQGSLLGAKLAALATLMAGFAVIVNFYSNLLLPIVSASGGSGLLRRMGAQAAATCAASIWVFLLVLGLRGLVLAVGGESGRRRTGPALRFAFMTALLAGLILSPNLTTPQVLAQIEASNRIALRPLLWFLGLDKWWAGGASAAWTALGRGAVRALVITALGAAGLYALGCRRQSREALSVPAAANGRAWRTAPMTRQQAVYRFAAATLTRSRRHGLYLSVWLGVGFAFVLEALAELAWHGSQATVADIQVAALAVPLVLCFFLLLGLRHLFTIPIELRANWIFRLSEAGPQPERLGAARRLMVVYGAAPVLLLAAPLSVRLWGWRLALVHLAVTALLAGLLIEVLLWRFRKLPFTCAYLPGKANAKSLWILYWLGFTLYAYTMAAWEFRLWARPVRLAVYLALGGLLWAGLARGRRRWSRGIAGCQFEDEPEELIQILFSRD